MSRTATTTAIIQILSYSSVIVSNDVCSSSSKIIRLI